MVNPSTSVSPSGAVSSPGNDGKVSKNGSGRSNSILASGLSRKSSTSSPLNKLHRSKSIQRRSSSQEDLSLSSATPKVSKKRRSKSKEGGKKKSRLASVTAAVAVADDAGLPVSASANTLETPPKHPVNTLGSQEGSAKKLGRSKKRKKSQILPGSQP